MLLSIARTTFLEAARQPIYFIVTLLTGVAMFFTTWGTGFSMGYTESGEVSGDDKLLLDLGLATIFLSGTILSGFLATAAMTREIERKTVLTVVSKPVPRPIVVLGKYLGVTGAVLIASLTMVGYLMLAIRHGVLSNASQDLDLPVVTLSFGAAGIAMLVGLWGNFFYGWSFSQTATLLLCPLMLLAAALAFVFGPQWNVMSIPKMGQTETVPMFFVQFKPQVLLAALCLTSAIAVLCAVAVAASTRLGQVMTLVICFGVLVLGLLSGPLVGRFAHENTPVGVIFKAEPFRERMVDFKSAGDRYVLQFKSAPGRVISVGDPVWYGAFPSGFDLAVGNFEPLPKEVRANPSTLAEPPLGTKPAVVITEVDAKLGKITIGQVAGSTEAVSVQRPPRENDHVFLTPTKVHPLPLIVSGMLPNLQNFWLLDAVSQGQRIPVQHVGLVFLYAGLLIASFLGVAVLMFQSRDVG